MEPKKLSKGILGASLDPGASPEGKSAATVKVNCLAWAFFGLMWSLVIIPHNVKTGQMTSDAVIPYHVFNVGSATACLYAFFTMEEGKATK